MSNENKFTVIVGKNGTGKSRILKAIVETFVDPESIERRRHSDGIKINPNPYLELDYEYGPSSVIAISTSPFDRFPLPEPSRIPVDPSSLNDSGYPHYEYLGLRGLFSRNLSLSFMSRAITALIDSVHENREHAHQICNVLNYLEYDGSIEARFQLPFSIGKIREILEQEDPVPLLFDYMAQRRDGWRINSLASNVYSNNLNDLVHALGRFIYALRRPRIDVVIDRSGVSSTNNVDLPIGRDFVLLLEFGFLRLREISLKKINSEKRINLNEASSGEQSVVMGFLGIAAHIRDGSLICIDEPEICLHPEWQERYIQLLISTFRAFKRCHFIVATHSPQIISRLEEDNCFVLNIETAEIVDARSVVKKSSDFQLANTFGAPGYKNEYLSRELITLLTQFSKSGRLSDQQVVFSNKLLKLKPVLDEADPVSKLMAMLEAVLLERSK
ncbi:AAA family ATPase [Burkholderia cepacia]|uniref:AAA family ATPase n=1 Tax=Burkholderia cepacia TaxID=292 RepID=UPI00398E6675